jgi:hypothetical protein
MMPIYLQGLQRGALIDCLPCRLREDCSRGDHPASPLASFLRARYRRA